MISFDPKSLPSDLECERFVLSAILEGPENAEVFLPRVTADHFTTEAHRLILDAARACLEAEGTVDRALIARRLQKEHSLEAAGGVSALVSLAEGMPHLCNVDGYIEILDKKLALRHLMRVGYEIGMRASIGTDDPADIARELQQGVDSLPRPLGGSLLSATEVVQAAGGLDHFLADQRETGLEVKFGPLTKILPILGAGRLITLAGPTGGGKSSLARQIALDAAADGSSVAVFSLEMGSSEVFRAMACTIARVSTRRLQLGEVDCDERHRLIEAVSKLERGNIRISDSASITPASIVASVKAMGKKQRVQLVIVDYLQLLSHVGKANTRTEQVDQISRALKRAAMNLQVPVLALVQWSNEGSRAANEGQEPGLFHIRESGSIAQDSDTVIFLVPKKSQGEAHGSKRPFRLVVKKNRSGPTGSVEVLFDAKHTIFEATA